MSSAAVSFAAHVFYGELLMNIQFFGAAQTVTGSCYILESRGIRFAVDCGMHQGNSEVEARNRETAAYRAGDLAFILLTHAHIDHSGLLPRIAGDGFKGPIYCTAPTADLLGIMLEDSAHIQETEAAWKQKKLSRHSGQLSQKDADAEPLYTLEEAQQAVSQCLPVEYGKAFSPAPGIEVVFHDAGHILGSAMLEIRITEDDKISRLLFSGDLGRPGMLLMHDPAVPQTHADYLFMESTYGNRNHKDEGATLEELAEAISYSYQGRDKVLIPAFAVGRTQEILYCLYLLNQKDKLPKDMPIYVDSPLAIRATEIFKKYSKLLDTPELAEFAADTKLRLPNIKFTLTAAESQELNSSQGPAIIIAGSGMCNAGRIRHHIRHNAWRKTVSLVFVGYQGAGTPGRRIVDGAKSLHMFNEDVAISARVYTIGGFSAHAGQNQMLDWIEKVHTPSMQVVLIHGEETAQQVFAEKIRERFNLPVAIPGYMEEMELTPGADETKMRTVAAAQKETRLNWDVLLKDTDAKMEQIRALIDAAKDRPWNEQVELRDRLLDLNRNMLSLLMHI